MKKHLKMLFYAVEGNISISFLSMLTHLHYLFSTFNEDGGGDLETCRAEHTSIAAGFIPVALNNYTWPGICSKHSHSTIWRLNLPKSVFREKSWGRNCFSKSPNVKSTLLILGRLCRFKICIELKQKQQAGAVLIQPNDFNRSLVR